MFNKNSRKKLIILSGSFSSALGYTNLSTAQVYNKLVDGDTLLVLDVREVYEYRAGHMAEPEGQLPLPPVNMPWSSSVLSEKYSRLPRDIDILVYCRSGARSRRLWRTANKIGRGGHDFPGC